LAYRQIAHPRQEFLKFHHIMQKQSHDFEPFLQSNHACLITQDTQGSELCNLLELVFCIQCDLPQSELSSYFFHSHIHLNQPNVPFFYHGNICVLDLSLHLGNPKHSQHSLELFDLYIQGVEYLCLSHLEGSLNFMPLLLMRAGHLRMV